MELLNKRKGKTRNKGYSLIELIITIAIIVVLTGLSFITLSLLGSARAKEAATDFDAQISDLAASSKNKLVILAGSERPKYCAFIKLYKDGDKYYVKKGYYNPTAVTNNERTLVEGEVVDNFSYTRYFYVEDENKNDDKGVGFSSKVKITYEAPDATKEKEITEDGVYIIYNRAGRCIGGDGVYHFYKSSNNANIANVTINKNGSHQTK